MRGLVIQEMINIQLEIISAKKDDFNVRLSLKT